MKKVLALVMVLCLACGCAMAEADILTVAGLNQALGFPLYDEPVSVTIGLVPTSAAIDFRVERNWMCQYLTQYSGLDITWQVIDPSSASDKIALILNSGDMPDCILGYGFGVNDIVQYGESEGLFMPINDLLQYCPNFSALLNDVANLKKEITAPDGSIYGFPALANIWSNKLRFFIQETWLNNVGMQNPTTLQELKDVLIAFRDQDANGNGDPSDEIPWSGSWQAGYPERDVILNAMGYVNDATNLAVDYNNGEQTSIVYVAYAERYKEYLQYMNDLWNEKLLDPDMFTQAETQVQANILEGICGVCSQASPVADDPEHQDEWRVLNPLADKEGGAAFYPSIGAAFSTAELVINADCDAEVAIAIAKLADVMYTVPWYGIVVNGPEYGSELDWNHDGHYYDAELDKISFVLPENMPNGWAHKTTNLTIWSTPGLHLNGYDLYMAEYGKQYPDTAMGEYWKDGAKVNPWNEEMNELCSQYYADGVPKMFFSVDDLARINELIVPLDDYVASMEAKFITGEVSIEGEYENFLKTLESYGVQELMEIYNRYYEAYKAN